ncbi:sigma factor-like helix-turn-helix DNA-binding protein [Dactylosporangium sp. NPDC051485]|uniref:sigma factor-like helix-turn-helix DNA-binding protein n=1 Tax=Dactylosporangium sp. NPDC051485 TaxID=3154846 RepID=UPI0034395DF5
MTKKGFREFVQARLPRLSRAACLLASGHAQAEDLLQAALIKTALAWKRIAEGDDRRPTCTNNLYHEHTCTPGRRRRWLEHSTADVPERATGADEMNQTLLRIVLQQALGRLTPRQRAVIVLRYVDDLSEADIAQVMGASVGPSRARPVTPWGRCASSPRTRRNGSTIRWRCDRDRFERVARRHRRPGESL